MGSSERERERSRKGGEKIKLTLRAFFFTFCLSFSEGCSTSFPAKFSVSFSAGFSVSFATA